MKKVIGLILVLGLMSTFAFADINKQISQDKMYDALKASKSLCENIETKVTRLRQKIEDILADEVLNLDPSDQTKMGLLPAELLEISDAAIDLKTKIETAYPEVD